MSKRREVAFQAIEAYNKWTIDAVMAYRDESCIQQILPKRPTFVRTASLKREPMNNAAYRVAFGAMMPLFRNFHVTVDDVFEDEANNKIAMSVHSTAETPIGPYDNEYVMMFNFTPDGSKIVRIREFVDSGASSQFFARLGEMAEGGFSWGKDAAAEWKAAPSGIGKSSKENL
ncbi:hypothetical protein E8E14_002572 [Neopestalotiopsis sp. 37M]|nr:hypothetical protein E8E14_002572 [Neopestalotiopsis sp. 37M]